jgi:hypothetical protein
MEDKKIIDAQEAEFISGGAGSGINRDTAVYLYAFMKFNKMQGCTLDEAVKILTRQGYDGNILSYVKSKWDSI